MRPGGMNRHKNREMSAAEKNSTKAVSGRMSTSHLIWSIGVK